MGEPEILKRKGTEPWSRELEQRLRSELKSIRHGSVSLVIQDGRVIQLDKSEKIRLI